MRPDIEAVSETLYLPRYALALESRADRPIVLDEEAVRLTENLNETLASSEKGIHRKLVRGRLPRTLITRLTLRIRHFDQVVRGFLERDPDGIVVSLGCGLSRRRRRVDDGEMRWFELELPAVIGLRRRYFEDTNRFRSIASSVLAFEWMDQLPDEPGERFLFLAEWLFMYLEESDVRRLVVKLREQFDGADLVAEVANRRVV
jgi:O-methyltransferase involved in polyketide biosynthesis